MFAKCAGLESLDLFKFNISNITDVFVYNYYLSLINGYSFRSLGKY